eukprot:CAMPEP_0172617182 /NCGR_PEP_ID=MMETSP1068-20121228/70091_1 /TAXON_ID=35684 /ORGANISM="Pseudopedinella elastica, Strain CCMP716" /LENGTH=164 /DNA_ID=CAMNT_0013422875 /DNA_START=72 /DNA_END=566 /DNA_ORIENTATION=+
MKLVQYAIGHAVLFVNTAFAFPQGTLLGTKAPFHKCSRSRRMAPRWSSTEERQVSSADVKAAIEDMSIKMEDAWADDALRSEARGLLIQKYLDLGKDLVLAEEEVDSYLADMERSGQYVLNLAYAKAPGNINEEPSQALAYVGVFFLGGLLSFGLRALEVKLGN